MFAVFHAARHCRFVPCTTSTAPRHSFGHADTSPKPLDEASTGLSTESVNPQQLLRRSVSEEVEFLRGRQTKKGGD